MFKFIHAADLHLDSPLRGLPDADGKHASLIRGGSRRALVKLIDEAIRLEIAFMVIAGDIWDGSWKEARTANFFLSQMQRLGEAGIDAYLVLGNHDLAGGWEKKFRSLVPKCVRVFDGQEAETVRKEYSGLAVALHGQSYETPDVKKNLAIGFPDKVQDHVNIGILHTSLAGDSSEHISYAPCSVTDLHNKGYDYWALGHIHQRRQIADGSDGKAVIAYSGVLQARHIRETGSKGAYLVEVPSVGERMKCTELDLADVRFSLLKIDLSEAQDRAELNRLVASKLQQLRAGLENLHCHAVRIEGTGASALIGELFFSENQWRDELTGIAAGVGPEIYIERATVSKHQISPSSDADASEAELAAKLPIAQEAEGMRAALNEQLRAVLGALPKAVLDELPDEVAAGNNDAEFASMLDEIVANIEDALGSGGSN